MAAVAIVGGSLTTLTFHNDTMAVVVIPAGVGSLDLRMLVNLQQSNILTFIYDPPVLTSLSPVTADTAGGPTLTLQGTSLGTGGVVYVGGSSGVCTLVAPGWSQTTIYCKLPPGEGQLLPVYVMVGTQRSNSLNFSYDAPLIYSSSPLAVATSGAYLTINGYSFGSGGVVTVGGAFCDVTVPPTLYSSKTIVCLMRPGQGVNYAVTVTTGVGQYARASNSSRVSYLPPTISGTTPTRGPTAGGYPITVSSHPHFFFLSVPGFG